MKKVLSVIKMLLEYIKNCILKLPIVIALFWLSLIFCFIANITYHHFISIFFIVALIAECVIAIKFKKVITVNRMLRFFKPKLHKFKYEKHIK